MDIIVIGRRSRFYAGTRYLKRGVNIHGKVANDCEVEQILQLVEGTNTKFCSLIQIRGSIPTHWSQETSVTQPKPPIVVSRVDPSYLATQEHFADLIHRYNLPIIVLDLVKHEERRPREVLVGKEYRQALDIVNNTIPLEHQIRYIALDYTKISKSNKHKTNTKTAAGPNDKIVGKEWALLEKTLSEQNNTNDTDITLTTSSSLNLSKQPTRVDLFHELDDIALYSISETGFFCTTTAFLNRVKILPNSYITSSNNFGLALQQGVLRTNCIDCLDRTNGGQFALGVKFLSTSLRALGLTDHKPMDPSNKMFTELMEMYGELGDRIAVQYGGSEAHNKMASAATSSSATITAVTTSTTTNNNKVKSSSKKQGELLTSIKRYYSNAFTDMVKQDAMNVFLGCYVPNEQPIPLWDLDSDFDLHNRSLHAPEPYINKILFNDMLRDIKFLLENDADPDINSIPNNVSNPSDLSSTNDLYTVENTTLSAFDHQRPTFAGIRNTYSTFDRKTFSDDSRSNSPTLNSRADSPSIDKIPSRISNEANPLSSKILNEFDTKQALQRYFIRSLHNSFNTAARIQLPNNILKTITRSERRKIITKFSKAKLTEAIEYWWKQSINLYFSIYQINPALKPNFSGYENKSVITFDGIEANHNVPRLSIRFEQEEVGNDPLIQDYYERVHKPMEITYFDDIFETDCFIPIVIGPIIDPRAQNKIVTSKNTDFSRTFVSSGFASVLPPFGRSSMKISTKIVEEEDEDDDNNDNNDSLNSPVIAENALSNADNNVSRNNNNSITQIRPIVVERQNSINTPKRQDKFSYDITSPYAFDDSNFYNRIGSESMSMISPRSNPSRLSFLSDNHSNHIHLNNNQLLDDSTNNINGNQSSLSGFHIRKYVREIGQKARYFVGGLLRNNDLNSTNDDNKDDIQIDDVRQSTNKWGYGYEGRNSMTDSSIFKPMNNKTASIYYNYSEESNNPLLFMNETKIDHEHKIDFQDSLRELLISCDSVKEMELLASDSYITTLINTNNEYKGCNHLDSAILVAGLKYNCFNFLENDLQNNLLELEVELTDNYNNINKENLSHHDHMKTNELNSTHPGNNFRARKTVVPTHARFPYDKALGLRDYFRDKLNEQSNRLNLSIGLESTIMNLCNSYLWEQVIHTRDLDTQRLSKRLSTLTSGRVIVDYASMFSRDILANDIDLITFIATDTLSFNSLKELEFLLDSLADVYEKYRQVKDEIMKFHQIRNESIENELKSNATENYQKKKERKM